MFTNQMAAAPFCFLPTMDATMAAISG